MSHFTVLVVMDEPPTHETIAPILQPWHEYECTGIKDQYVIEVDVTDDVRETFESSVSAVKLADGTFSCRYDRKFYTSATDPNDVFSRPGFELPDGAEEVELAADEARQHGLGHATMRDAAIYEHGDSIIERDDRFYYLTNPNRKWDWWVIGGRWSGLFRLKPGAASGVVGGPGLMRPGAPCGTFDGGRMEDIDWSTMKSTEVAQRRAKLAEIAQKTGLTTEQVVAACILNDAAHAAWMELPGEKPRGDAHGEWLVSLYGEAGEHLKKVHRATWNDPPKMVEGQTADSWAQAAAALITYAVVKDGQWYARGSMGWWGISSGETDDWDAKFTEMLAMVRLDQFVVVVDCHI
ncbi:hypothetical protein [Aureimonas phyllosphaerae]|uniref:Uncharacterized protein n=1 Tax=Aureimonas phyllosphaerae TaxID=1166078 RepID=A0A7W6BTG3_9HYPH|nr:hypothetical protein [Aureimonas phyllosphaerae]MBB3937716.1 hypothetical protein [Aureimonas phyllosphaerae]MBB3961749.1 hypothetical protein [Aureimonas phyllosphaerae]SFF45385.1 hypothetical protein SAMN05216566_11454 [Aureimonas phyllosphaerae]